jgi:hypothetical protein
LLLDGDNGTSGSTNGSLRVTGSLVSVPVTVALGMAGAGWAPGEFGFGPFASVPASGALGAPEAGCGSGEFDCGQASAADNANSDASAIGERFIA